MNRPMILHCCGCNRFVSARLTTGSEVYPNNLDLKAVNDFREAYEAKARQAWHERHGIPFEE